MSAQSGIESRGNSNRYTFSRFEHLDASEFSPRNNKLCISISLTNDKDTVMSHFTPIFGREDRKAQPEPCLQKDRANYLRTRFRAG